MNSQSLRQAFVEFFVERGHTHLPSLSLVPSDPSITTLFTIAGVQQMIPYFLGREEPPNKRLVTVQRVVRTPDIEEVGDFSHLTFLEMLGNFSVGDYFKREAIAFTWEFLTGIVKIPEDRWWATIYPGDEEAREAWLAIGMPAERIGESEENWWAQGPVGPCGPDSEIHYDRGLEYGCGRVDCRPENECCERFLEVWNNVFMVYFQEESGQRRELPWRNIDTGMGLERLTMAAQGVQTVYDTDLFQPVIASVSAIAGLQYGQNPKVDRSLRIIADHSRTITFLTMDGVKPSSDGRGYVLRRLLRRAALHGRLMGIDRPFMEQPVGAVIEVMSGYYSQLIDSSQRIRQVVHQEERRFLQTLSRGLGIFEELAEKATRDGKVISGEDAFVLYDTHGFPLELTEELANERGISIDEEGFGKALTKQQERAREKQKLTRPSSISPQSYLPRGERIEPTIFTGYEELESITEVVGIIAEGESVSRAEAGDKVEIVLASTPFYAESGGQVGDAGVIRGESGQATISDTQRPTSTLIVHRPSSIEGSISVGDVVKAEVDAVRRLHILPHHSGTHLLHKALQEVLGEEAVQAGSLVAADRLRFDFRWPRPMTLDEVREVQDRVNAAIWANLPVVTEVEAYDQAIRDGAMALFGEKYGDRVRVVKIGDWSKELCGGTHVKASGDIGLLVILSETGTGSGIRRIEALAGASAYAYVNDLRDSLSAAAEALDTRPENLPNKAKQVMNDAHELQKRTEHLTRRLASQEAESLIREGTSIDGMTVVANRITADSMDYLKDATDAVKSRLDRGIVVLGTVIEDKPQFTMAITGNVKEAGFDAAKILREAVSHAKGGAGGTQEFASGGGRDVSKLDEVLETAVILIKQRAEA